MQRIYFFIATTTSTSYLDMLEQFLQPQLFADNILDFVVFQQTALCANCAELPQRDAGLGFDESHHCSGQHARVI